MSAFQIKALDDWDMTVCLRNPVISPAEPWRFGQHQRRVPLMGYTSGLEVRVCCRGGNYAWELWHPGNAEAWRFSVPICESAEAARNAGSRALMIILGRFGKKMKKPKK